MSRRAAARRGAAVVVLGVAIVFGTSGCGQPAPAAAPSAAPAAPASSTEPSSAAADPTAEAGVEADTADLSVDPGASAVAGPDVAQSVSDELTRIVGQSPDSVTCPDLPATVGAEIRCELVSAPDTYGVTVTATAVQGSDVAFDIVVDDYPS